MCDAYCIKCGTIYHSRRWHRCPDASVRDSPAWSGHVFADIVRRLAHRDPRMDADEVVDLWQRNRVMLLLQHGVALSFDCDCDGRCADQCIARIADELHIETTADDTGRSADEACAIYDALVASGFRSIEPAPPDTPYHFLCDCSRVQKGDDDG